MELGNQISLLFCIPFLGMLLSIAVFPLVKPVWWEKNKKYMVILWSALFLIPFAVRFGFHTMMERLAEVVAGDYLTFIVLLFGLFCVSSNITLKSNLAGSPRVNLIFLLIGTVLAGWVGTTGASMLMIRPVIKANQWRKRKVHTIVFFIFLVSNMGGVLTPVGDPPMLMGFMRKVPFFWSFHMIVILLLNVAILLTIYYILDVRAYSKDLKEGLHPEEIDENVSVRLLGAHNFIFMGIIVLAVILSGMLPNIPAFSGGIPIFGEVELAYADLVEMVIILFAALLSFRTTRPEIRRENNFSWGPIQEVAVLFIGIFITMVPALLILEAKGSSLPIRHAWQIFWTTGAMSSFLDNTPTYLVFLTTAGTLGATSGVATSVGIVSQKMLFAISAGAVFMGANTYIGNAPNFMVKAIAEDEGIRMPSFFGYMLWSLRYLIPVFVIDTLIFLI
jgi:Na+/H+ antiporter NhaD/arsenite permease-like protein